MSVSLRSLSDIDILSRVRALVARERELTLSVLLHMNEIERRQLHLKQGHASMFDYCTSGLGYSASAAARRIRTARCVARFPEVYDLLKTNEVNVSTVSQVSRILNAQNKDVLLARIRGKSQREVEAVVAEYQPRAMLRDIVRPVVVRVPAESAAQGPAAPAVDTGVTEPAAEVSAREGACEKSAYCRSGSVADAGADRPADPGEVGGVARFERRALIQFSASEAFMAKVERVRSLAWHRLPANASLEQVFELALDCLIAHEDPAKRRERRQERERSIPARDPGTATTAVSHAHTPQVSAQQTRHIPAPVRDEVFVRDKGRCTYTGSNGQRCASTNALQIDHITPVARGGPSTPHNLRLLCAYHNRLEAERLMGCSGNRAGPPAR